jgi:hypothetical protein
MNKDSSEENREKTNYHKANKKRSDLFPAAIETSLLFLLGTFGSSLSGFLHLPPISIVVLAALCILISSIISIKFKSLSDSSDLKSRKSTIYSRSIPVSMIGIFPFGICLGLLIAIPTALLIPDKFHFTAPNPFPVTIDSYNEAGEYLGVKNIWTSLRLGVNQYEAVSTIAILLISSTAALYIGAHRSAALVAGWSIGASVAFALIKPNENPFFITLFGHIVTAIIISWLLIRLRSYLMKLRTIIELPRG